MNPLSAENLFDFISKKNFKKIKALASGKQTPFLLIDLKKIARKFDELKQSLPFAKIYYAVKANPNDDVIKLLAKKGSSFDVASIGEIKQLLNLGVHGERMSFGNTIKKAADIAYAFENGITLFTTDSVNDLKNIAKKAPGSRVFLRILTEGSGADWPLSRKFGAHPDMIFRLILKAKQLNLVPYGISFHVGSQQRHIGQWDSAISQCKYLFDTVKNEGVKLQAINIGGGLPARYLQPAQDIQIYTDEILRFLEKYFKEDVPEIIIEPGRSMVAEAGVIVSEIVLISEKSKSSQHKWVYLDIGKFGGLIETMGEAIKYPIFVEAKRSHKDSREFILAGPTCDSVDILYEDFKYQLPKNIKAGERVYILTAGAYTRSYSSNYFNGIPPLQEFVF
ncbi:type III PLP-dependent enzyme [Patescibacteria group bacterium]|nr:type III PLP-dependent enzyme [Patescibacteria group bacterium]